jgi:hypothetical protein
MDDTDTMHAEIIDVADASPEAWYELAEERGWGDGLPTLPPTEESISRFLAAASWAEQDLPGPIPPRWVRPTAASLAANAVMAGCRPEYFEVVLAGLHAVLEEPFNLTGVLATTHPCTPILIVSGPARLEIGLNCGAGCLGQGTRANAATGRAFHLVMQNIGGAVPGKMDLATHGAPTKFSYCFGENQEVSPWAPYHVRQGFAAHESVVTVMASEAPHNINDHGSETGDELVTTIAGTISQVGCNNLLLGGPHLLVLGPEHAATLHEDHWTVEQIQEAVFERSRIPVDRVAAANRDEIASWGRRPENGAYTVGNTPDELHVLVAGGRGKHSLWIPTFAASQAVSHRIGEASRGR